VEEPVEDVHGVALQVERLEPDVRLEVRHLGDALTVQVQDVVELGGVRVPAERRRG
jgi:hypothetical protein